MAIRTLCHFLEGKLSTAASALDQLSILKAWARKRSRCNCGLFVPSVTIQYAIQEQSLKIQSDLFKQFRALFVSHQCGACTYVLVLHTHLLILLLVHLQSQEEVFMLKVEMKEPCNYKSDSSIHHTTHIRLFQDETRWEVPQPSPWLSAHRTGALSREMLPAWRSRYLGSIVGSSLRSTSFSPV